MEPRERKSRNRDLFGVTYKLALFFIFTASIPEIEIAISLLQHLLPQLPQSHPQRVKYLESLAKGRFLHYTLSGVPEQLDKSILHFTEALLLPLPRTRPMPNIIQLFFHLTSALFHRTTTLKQPDDVKYCVEYLRYLRDQPLELLGVPRKKVTSDLVVALAVRVELKCFDVMQDIMQDIEEMAILCCEFLTSNINTSISESSLTIPVMALANTAMNNNYDGEPLAQVIECLREANRRLPHFHELSLAFACCLTSRFNVTHSIDDYDEATSILDRFIGSGPQFSQDIPLREIALETIAGLAFTRATIYGKPEYLEEASHRFRTYLSMASLENSDPRRSFYSMVLAQIAAQRFRDFGVRGVQDARSGDPALISSPSLTALIESRPPSIGGPQYIPHYQVLRSVMDITDVAEMEEAIKSCRLLVASFHPSHPFVHLSVTVLATLLFNAFERTGKIEYLNESIALNLKTPGRRGAIVPLLSSLLSRFGLLRRREDFEEIMRLFPMAVNNARLPTPVRFMISCKWAMFARLSRHPSIMAAYENSISLMQDSLYYAPTLEIQHFHLLTVRDNYEKLPLDYASYQVHIGQLKQAVETLERGRALLWSEMRGFRTAVDQLGAVDSALAAKFIAINSELEELTMSTVPGGNMETDSSGVEGSEGLDPFGRLLVKQRKLLEERNSLVSQVRSLPDFKSFLMSPSFDTLRSAASRGPVIIINHCKWLSDILILLHDSPPSLITTIDDFYDRAIQLGDRLVKTRNEHRLESKQYQRILRSTLQGLYELVGRPVIEEFHKLKIPEQSRVWWCPTSVFCSLPLHAMGPIPSDDGVKRYFSDLYIPSYTPTLSALIESRKPGRQTSGKPSMLLVAQPESLRDAIPEIWLIQGLNTKVTSLISKGATHSSVVEGLRGHQFSHFVCHGTLESGKPFDASFQLHGSERLTLLDIVRSRLPTAEFAFLSACHTAEMTDGSIADEGLHLTAAMQYCGFRSVVGTMWAMADADGQDLVGDFYESILSSEEPGVPYYERSALALRDAVKKLRSKNGVLLERWVNFVHYGA